MPSGTIFSDIQLGYRYPNLGLFQHPNDLLPGKRSFFIGIILRPRGLGQNPAND
jgi:hypothetical protein